MHVSLLDLNISHFWQHKKETTGDLYEIKAEKVEVETQSVGKPSSSHVDSPGDSQSSTGEAQPQLAADPCKPRDSQNVR